MDFNAICQDFTTP